MSHIVCNKCGTLHPNNTSALKHGKFCDSCGHDVFKDENGKIVKGQHVARA